MAATVTHVFSDEEGQLVHIPQNFHFASDKVYLERDALDGSLRLSEQPLNSEVDAVSLCD